MTDEPLIGETPARVSHATNRKRTMQKLIQRYRANPTDANARAVLAYNNKHPFASLLLPADDRVLVAKLYCADVLGGL